MPFLQGLRAVVSFCFNGGEVGPNVRPQQVLHHMPPPKNPPKPQSICPGPDGGMGCSHGFGLRLLGRVWVSRGSCLGFWLQGLALKHNYNFCLNPKKKSYNNTKLHGKTPNSQKSSQLNILRVLNLDSNPQHSSKARALSNSQTILNPTNSEHQQHSLPSTLDHTAPNPESTHSQTSKDLNPRTPDPSQPPSPNPLNKKPQGFELNFSTGSSQAGTYREASAPLVSSSARALGCVAQDL